MRLDREDGASAHRARQPWKALEKLPQVRHSLFLRWGRSAAIQSPSVYGLGLLPFLELREGQALSPADTQARKMTQPWLCCLAKPLLLAATGKNLIVSSAEEALLSRARLRMDHRISSIRLYRGPPHFPRWTTDVREFSDLSSHGLA